MPETKISKLDKSPSLSQEREKVELSRMQKLRDKSVDWVSNQFESEQNHRALLEMSNQFKLVNFLINSNYEAISKLALTDEKAGALIDITSGKKDLELKTILEKISNREAIDKSEAATMANSMKEISSSLTALDKLNTISFSFKDYIEEVKELVLDTRNTPDTIKGIVETFAKNLSSKIDKNDLNLQVISEKMIDGLKEISLNDREALAIEFDKLAEAVIVPDEITRTSVKDITKEIGIDIENKKEFDKKYGVLLEKVEKDPAKSSVGALKQVDSFITSVADFVGIMVVLLPLVVGLFQQFGPLIKEAFFGFVGKFTKSIDDLIYSVDNIFTFGDKKKPLTEEEQKEWKSLYPNGVITGASRGFKEDKESALNSYGKILKKDSEIIGDVNPTVTTKTIETNTKEVYNNYSKNSELQTQKTSKPIVVPMPIPQEDNSNQNSQPIYVGGKTVINDPSVSRVNTR